jgi:hypothetical protein
MSKLQLPAGDIERLDRDFWQAIENEQRIHDQHHSDGSFEKLSAPLASQSGSDPK